jgi:hypothetical protein
MPGLRTILNRVPKMGDTLTRRAGDGECGPRLRFGLVWGLMLLMTSVVAADELRTVDNKSYSGTLESLDDKEVAIKTAEGLVKKSLDNVLALDLKQVMGIPPGTSYIEVRLVDETVLLCTGIAIKGKEMEVQLHSGQELKLPLTSVVAILRGAEEGKVRKAFDAFVDERVKYDRLVVVKEGVVNNLDGTLGEVDAKGETIGFKDKDGNVFPKGVGLSKLRGLIFYREAPANLQPICMVYDVSGTAIAANKVVARDNDLIVTTTIPKVTLTLARDKIARFDYNMGKLTFLSDLTPSKILEQSAVGLIVTHRKDVNLDGDPIVLGTQGYTKGLSLHAHTELEYNLKGKYKKFTAVVGVDPRIGGDSQAKLTIEVDGHEKFSKVITAAETVDLNIDVTKANAIRIIVTSSNFLDLHDHVTIAAPKVTQ